MSAILLHRLGERLSCRVCRHLHQLPGLIFPLVNLPPAHFSPLSPSQIPKSFSPRQCEHYHKLRPYHQHFCALWHFCSDGCQVVWAKGDTVWTTLDNRTGIHKNLYSTIWNNIYSSTTNLFWGWGQYSTRKKFHNFNVRVLKNTSTIVKLYMNILQNHTIF